jgi:predicted metal-dependent phosphoesterase TrpH
LARSTPRPSRAAASPHRIQVAPRAALRALTWPIVITLLVLASAAVAVDPIWDAATLDAIGEARLDFTAGYLSIAPISSVLDTLTLLTVGQHIAILLSVIVLFAANRVRLARRRDVVLWRELLAAAGLLAVFLVVYGSVAIMPRPMAQLVTSDATIITLDFHSHTKYSHDGRGGWNEEDVRAWHRAAGFDAVYITDHATFEGAERGIAGNSGQAGEGTIVLQGLEAVDRGEHVNILSAGRRYKGLTTLDLRDVDDQALALADLIRGTSPILIETIPGNLSKLSSTAPNVAPSVDAIEIVDGSPRGLSQARRERARIVRLADSLNLALVTGSDNHGWGRAAPGWTMLRIPGWRGMPTDSLSRRIEEILRIGRRQATRVIERRIADGTSPIALVFALPAVAWRMFTTLGADERVMWLVWAWGIVAITRGFRAYLRQSPTAV